MAEGKALFEEVGRSEQGEVRNVLLGKNQALRAARG